MARIHKKIRQGLLQEKLEASPFLTDEELAGLLGVSIPTIRLDRLELGIPEVRERTKQMAENVQSKLKTLDSGEIVGELIDLELGRAGISILKITSDMVFEKTKVARGHYVFSQANSLALAVIDAPVAVTGVANIKYKVPIHIGEKLIAKAEVMKKRGNKYFVWVKTRNNKQEVFRAKFIIVSLENQEHVIGDMKGDF
ncbi:Transcription factor FapR [Propionispora sp. 2/2-37]|uniref:transcription factor FapR n=1 Tax=Propionispora sp. 2/2-37 TaxID=1677858 RepID=UPI0006BB5BDB|nr:transcription factor FapR [Propionispora sp. 2/2-37]CUH95605.1 Transcription factor FapR [Propionispora sp. 2/2-37]